MLEGVRERQRKKRFRGTAKISDERDRLKTNRLRNFKLGSPGVLEVACDHPESKTALIRTSYCFACLQRFASGRDDKRRAEFQIGNDSHFGNSEQPLAQWKIFSTTDGAPKRWPRKAGP